MSDTAVHRRFEDILAGIQQPARLIGGESGAGSGFGEDTDEFRVVLGFPDTYEIGISSQAMQILYHVAESMEGVAVERTYLPWVDAICAMRREGIPLLTLETWSPVADADLVGLTLQHELAYTNLLEMLDLSGIPLRWSDRTDAHPLVVAGGPACADFLPLSRFLDAVAVGDGEELFTEILETTKQAKSEQAGRIEVKQRLSTIDGVYVPGISDRVTRRVITRLEGAAYPDSCIVPQTAGVHDRAWVEIMRGCTRGCRFCQAGIWYRPVRERSPAEILRLAEAQLHSSGHRELAFGSLSTTDYSCLEDVLAKTAQDHPEVRVSLPSLRVDSAAVRLARLVSPTGPSLTLAPEAGSQRMRDIINKNVTEADFMAAVEEALSAGRTTIKLYFMIGLPLECDADVVAVADLCLRARELGRSLLGPRAGRLQVKVSVNNFVPKPFTPFQWAGMADGATLTHRQKLLRARLRKPGIRISMHAVDSSYLEAALARGGEEMGAVIEEAWNRGARFDSWTEQFRIDAWKEAFASVGTTAESIATTAISPDRPLPWDIIDGVADRGFLWSEWERAQRGESTADCRWEGCYNCGACDGSLANDLAAALDNAPGATGSSQPGTVRAVVRGAIRTESACRLERRLRYVATFSVTGRGRFLGHLDRLEVLRRAVHKAGGRLALTAGMRPKPILKLALPLAVGVEGLCELAEFELAEEPSLGFATRLADALPRDMQLTALDRYEAAKSLPARVVAASYEVEVSHHGGQLGASDVRSAVAKAASLFSGAVEVPIEETRKGDVRRVDVKHYVDHITVEKSTTGKACTLSFRTAVTPLGTVRPEIVVEALGRLIGAELQTESVRRVGIHLS